jgi:hypothetical protein
MEKEKSKGKKQKYGKKVIECRLQVGRKKRTGKARNG